MGLLIDGFDIKLEALPQTCFVQLYTLPARVGLLTDAQTKGGEAARGAEYIAAPSCGVNFCGKTTGASKAFLVLWCRVSTLYSFAKGERNGSRPVSIPDVLVFCRDAGKTTVGGIVEYEIKKVVREGV